MEISNVIVITLDSSYDKVNYLLPANILDLLPMKYPIKW